jgi:lipid-A-disaccharide synthase-like uncharacterized protein
MAHLRIAQYTNPAATLWILWSFMAKRSLQKHFLLQKYSVPIAKRGKLPLPVHIFHLCGGRKSKEV